MQNISRWPRWRWRLSNHWGEPRWIQNLNLLSESTTKIPWVLIQWFFWKSINIYICVCWSDVPIYIYKSVNLMFQWFSNRNQSEKTHGFYHGFSQWSSNDVRSYHGFYHGFSNDVPMENHPKSWFLPWIEHDGNLKAFGFLPVLQCSPKSSQAQAEGWSEDVVSEIEDTENDSFFTG